MMKHNYLNKASLFICLIILFGISLYYTVFFQMPNEVVLLEGEKAVYDIKSPFLIKVKSENDHILQLNKQKIIVDKVYQVTNSVLFSSEKLGNTKLYFSLFGVVPLRTATVEVISNKKVEVCGNVVGVKLEVNGILVIGATEIETVDGKKRFPSQNSGIKAGDFILSINNKKLMGIEDLIREIDQSNGNALKMSIRRGESTFSTNITPVLDSADKKYHIGLWVRDNCAGIGTLTFYDPETNQFGALGHGITDIDTGIIFPIISGEIYKSQIISIKRGYQGSPGELKGVFSADGKRLGIVTINSVNGIYGQLHEREIIANNHKLFPIAVRSQIKEGSASILADISGNNVTEYSAEIQKVLQNNGNEAKGLIIKITDQRLLDATGGIVQGMSGSPILQNGRVIGAITHVLVNDPKRGYGIFIDTMIRCLSGNNLSGYVKVK